MYDNFEKLVKLNNVSVYKVSKDTGISYSALSEWKAGRSTPKADKLQKLADYFGVSIEYLMTGKEKQFDMFSEENADLLARIAKDEQAMKLMNYFLRLNAADKKEVEMIILYKLKANTADNKNE